MFLLKQILSVAVALLVAAGGWLVSESGGRTVTGPARITDGDSLRVNGVEIRLKGVDAPEMRQTCERAGRPYRCGEEARRVLSERIGDGSLTCRIEGRDRYRRALARCRVDGADLGAWLVEQGWAVGYRDYEREEARARRRRAGLWVGEFQRPIDWRREHTARS